MPFIKSNQEYQEEHQEQKSDEASQKSTFASLALEYFAEFVKIFIIAAAIILPVRLFLVQPFYVRGQSMEPNFHDSEYLIIDKLSPRFKPYSRGEVVVFRFDSVDQRYLIKRIIGLPGESIHIANKRITITNNDHPKGLTLDEKYIHLTNLVMMCWILPLDRMNTSFLAIIVRIAMIHQNSVPLKHVRLSAACS